MCTDVEASAQAFKAMAHRSEKDGSLPDRMNRSDGSYPRPFVRAGGGGEAGGIIVSLLFISTSAIQLQI